jgi:hypothetical protein
MMMKATFQVQRPVREWYLCKSHLGFIGAGSGMKIKSIRVLYIILCKTVGSVCEHGKMYFERPVEGCTEQLQLHLANISFANPCI